ncbi:hypothetical protein CYMTET_52904 [Cymbomonas tetramitiformis]|uniref:Uncharacterized protein n=1 Tax=Cymbomonas tetramitiformis TaxID=36881 RepID=A0AAE0EQL2_9CHLO|nr:hypothetical protein CYMTET_52904 [Cymbomonas tetramitiformis]
MSKADAFYSEVQDGFLPENLCVGWRAEVVLGGGSEVLGGGAEVLGGGAEVVLVVGPRRCWVEAKCWVEGLGVGWRSEVGGGGGSGVGWRGQEMLVGGSGGIGVEAKCWVEAEVVLVGGSGGGAEVLAGGAEVLAGVAGWGYVADSVRTSARRTLNMYWIFLSSALALVVEVVGLAKEWWRELFGGGVVDLK